jgi:hypothetical protein
MTRGWSLWAGGRVTAGFAPRGASAARADCGPATFQSELPSPVNAPARKKFRRDEDIDIVRPLLKLRLLPELPILLAASTVRMT